MEWNPAQVGIELELELAKVVQNKVITITVFLNHRNATQTQRKSNEIQQKKDVQMPVSPCSRHFTYLGS